MTTRLYYSTLALPLRPFTAWLLCSAAGNLALIERVLRRLELADEWYIPFGEAA